jgi:hypothetical protein
MWYTGVDEDEEGGGKGIEQDDEDESEEEEDEFYEEGTGSELEGGEGGPNGSSDYHGDGVPKAYLENFMRAVDHGLSLLVHWSTKNWYQFISFHLIRFKTKSI